MCAVHAILCTKRIDATYTHPPHNLSSSSHPKSHPNSLSRRFFFLLNGPSKRRLRWLLLPRPSSTTTTRARKKQGNPVSSGTSLSIRVVVVILFACRNRADGGCNDVHFYNASKLQTICFVCFCEQLVGLLGSNHGAWMVWFWVLAFVNEKIWKVYVSFAQHGLCCENNTFYPEIRQIRS